MESYGNISWHFYVTASYGLAALTFIATVWYHYKNYKTALEQLNNEGASE